MPTVAEIFKETRQPKSGVLDEESASKLVYEFLPLQFVDFSLLVSIQCPN